MHDLTTQLSTQKSFSVASYLSSFLSAMGGAMTLNDIAVLLGIALALLTFGINWLYQAAKNRRDARQEERDARQEEREAELHAIEKRLAEAKLAKFTPKSQGKHHGKDHIASAGCGAAE